MPSQSSSTPADIFSWYNGLLCAVPMFPLYLRLVFTSAKQGLQTSICPSSKTVSYNFPVAIPVDASLLLFPVAMPVLASIALTLTIVPKELLGVVLAVCEFIVVEPPRLMFLLVIIPRLLDD